jgi:hypothetical protein
MRSRERFACFSSPGCFHVACITHMEVAQSVHTIDETYSLDSRAGRSVLTHIALGEIHTRNKWSG